MSVESPKQQLGKTQQLELEFDLTRVRDVAKSVFSNTGRRSLVQAS